VSRLLRFHLDYFYKRSPEEIPSCTETLFSLFSVEDPSSGWSMAGLVDLILDF
jgi:hypothetical protein